MFQRNYVYEDSATFQADVRPVREYLDAHPQAKALFHFYNDTSERSFTDEAVAALREVVPDAAFIGCSTSGNINDGAFVAKDGPCSLTVVCDVYEDPDTKLEVHQFQLDQAHRRQTTDALLSLVAQRPWVKAVEMLTTIIDVRMYDFCAEVSHMRDDIVFFGGGALCSETVDMFTGLPYVFSSAGGNDGHAVAFVLYGGERFFAATEAIVGWKPLGMPLAITKAEGPRVYELDGRPAFERYYHYLRIENDDAFSAHSLQFPLAIDHGGQLLIKAPVKVEDDGSLTLTSDLADDQTECRIAYGDPATILHSIKDSARAMRDFGPQAILAFSCASRLMYWGDDFVSRETLPFNSVAPTAGFYTGGEFARYKGDVLHHNVTLVVAGLREGMPAAAADGDIDINETEFSRQMAIVNSLAAFVGVTSSELQEAYDRLEAVAKTDGLTALNDRREIERLIEDAIADFEGTPAELAANAGTGAGHPVPTVIMLDLDDFKKVNDAYGHKAGDEVLKGLGEILSDEVDGAGIGASGRWGGEEFMVLLPCIDLAGAKDVSERIRTRFAGHFFGSSGKHTLSLGLAQLLPGENGDLLCLRADKALYAAKRNGKNCLVVA